MATEYKKIKRSVTEGKDEMNLAELPISILTTRRKEVPHILEFNKEKRFKNKLVYKQQWKVETIPEVGLPTVKDEGFLLGLFALAKRQGFPKKTYFTTYELLNIMGVKRGKRWYQEVERAISRLQALRVTSDNCWWNNKKKEYIGHIEATHLIESYTFWYKYKSDNKVEEVKKRKNSITWSDLILQSFKHDFIKSLDLNFYITLEQGISQRLYRLLDKWLYKKSDIEIDIFELRDRLGMSRERNKYVSRIWQKLTPACEELKNREFLEKYKILQNRRVKFVKALKGELKADNEDRSKEVEELTARGISIQSARELLKKYSDRIHKHIEIFDYLKRQDSHLIKKNPAGFLRKSIEKDYAPPQGFLEVKEEEITQAIEKLSEEELQRLKEAARNEAERGSSLTPGNDFYEKSISVQTEAILRSKVRERLNPG